MTYSLQSSRKAVLRFTTMALSVVAGCSNPPAPPSAEFSLPPGLTGDTTEFRATLASFRTGDHHVRQRRPKCWYCLKKIDVLIEPQGVTTEINPAEGPAEARPVAHLKNLDPEKTEKYYQLAPQDDYYLWVSRNKDTGKAQWTLLLFSHRSARILAGETRDLNYCHVSTKPIPPGATDADFAADRPEGKCSVPIRVVSAEAGATVTRASVAPTMGLLAVIEHSLSLLTEYALMEGGWIYCNNGCCT